MPPKKRKKASPGLGTYRVTIPFQFNLMRDGVELETKTKTVLQLDFKTRDPLEPLIRMATEFRKLLGATKSVVSFDFPEKEKPDL